MKERVIKHKRTIAIVLAVCLYFALLSMISFVRAPRERQATGESIVNYEDFSVEAEDGRAWLDGAGLHFSDTENTVKKFSAMISLEEFQQIQVEFVVECPQEYAGAAMLHVDLCADGYDADAQEFVVELKAGRNKISQVIDKGDSAPEKAQFRIFCLDAVQCDISDLNVQTVEEISYTGMFICAAIIIGILLLLLLALGVTTRGGEEKSTRKEMDSKPGMQKRKEPMKASIPSTALPTFFVCLFLSVLFLPSLLGLGKALTGKTFDIALHGYTDTTQKPAFSLQSFWTGQFQSDYSAWYQENFQPRGVFTKNYATLRYNLFQLGNGGRIIGKNYDIFEPAYINSELCINGASDFSQMEAQERAKEYMAKLEQLQDKLAKHGKVLYIVMTPSKADFHRENIPDGYVALSDQNVVSGEDYVAELLNKSDIPHLICAEQKGTLSYPAFYHSGIHWSRTFEQETFVAIINDLSRCTGRVFPHIELGDVAAQVAAPYWRDADLFDLLNIWNPYTETYYQYDLNAVYPDNCEDLGVLFQGSSFSHGFYEGFAAELPLETSFYMNRASYLQGANETVPFQSFDEIDLTSVLSRIDAVVIELLPAEIESYSYGFVEYLLSFLDTYTPAPPNYMASLDVASSDTWDTAYFKGFYAREATHVWTHKSSQVTIKDSLIRQAGLELNYTVSDHLVSTAKPVHVKVCINGVQIFDEGYNEMWEGSVVIPPDQLPSAADDVYEIELLCDSSFVPAEVLGTEDTRELSLVLRYIGRAR